MRNLNFAGTVRVAQILHAVEQALASSGYNNVYYEFIVNTIESANSDVASLTITGVCSPVTRNSWASADRVGNYSEIA